MDYLVQPLSAIENVHPVGMSQAWLITFVQLNLRQVGLQKVMNLGFVTEVLQNGCVQIQIDPLMRFSVGTRTERLARDEHGK